MRFGKLEITSGFLLIVAWMNYLDQQCLVPAAMVACICHEMGHYIMIRWLGGDIKCIRLTAIGAEMVLAAPLSYWQEGLSALAGPVTNLLLAMLFCRWDWALSFAGLNLVLALFNLLPIGRLDGGRALHCVLALLVGPTGAELAGKWLDGACTVILLTIGMLLAGAGGNVTLLLVALWLLGLTASRIIPMRRSCVQDWKDTFSRGKTSEGPLLRIRGLSPSGKTGKIKGTL